MIKISLLAYTRFLPNSVAFSKLAVNLDHFLIEMLEALGNRPQCICLLLRINQGAMRHELAVCQLHTNDCRRVADKTLLAQS